MLILKINDTSIPSDICCAQVAKPPSKTTTEQMKSHRGFLITKQARGLGQNSKHSQCSR